MSSSQRSSTPSSAPYRNPLETLRDVGSSVAGGMGNAARDLTTGFFDQMMGVNSSVDRSPSREQYNNTENQQKPSFKRESKNIWSFQQEQEMRTIKELVEQIKQEIKLLKQADSALLNEVKDIEKLTIDTLPVQPGIYHIRFLELVISILKTLRQKINESRTWLAAFNTKKKKRGSAFSARSKKQGTQYSLSQELMVTRSVQ